jgi:hypothetical protein
VKKLLGSVLSAFIVLNGWSGAVLFAEEEQKSEYPIIEHETPAIPKTVTKTTLSEEAWRGRLTDLRAQRTGLMVLGIGGAVAGLALIGSGVKDNQDAQDTPGCSVSGSTVYCQDEESTRQAQDKIDKGDQKMAIGGVAALAGAGFIVWGAMRGAKARRLQRDGVNSGYTVDVRPNRDGLSLVLNRNF